MADELAPVFKCEACGWAVDALREGADKPWEPQPCWRCRIKAQDAQAMRGRRKAAREAFDLDVDAFVRQVKALPVFRDCPRSIKKTLVVIAYSALDEGGRAHGNRMVRIRVSPETRLWWLLETVVHELVHCALPAHVSHNERFRLTLARAARELWGLEVDPNPKEEKGRTRKYTLDALIEQHLACELAEGRLKYPKKAPVVLEPPEATAARRTSALATLVEKRAEHALRMMARAEKRSKAAQRTLTKWREKVRYYERQAAKKASK